MAESSAKVTQNDIQKAINLCKNARLNFEKSEKALTNSLTTAGQGWNDKQYGQVKDIVKRVCDSFKGPKDKLKDNEAQLKEFLKIIEKYDNLNIESSNG